MAVEPDKAKGNVVQPHERLATALVIALIGAVIVWDGAQQADASAYFPVAIGAAMIVLSAVTIVSFNRAVSTTDEAPVLKGFAGLAILAIFIGLAGNAGFLTASIAFIPAMALVGGDRNFPRIALGTIAFVVLAYAVFNLALSQPLPAELILGD